MDEQLQSAAPAAAATEPATPDVPRNLWLVPHPTHQWEQDVRALARARGLQIVDPDWASDEDRARAAPDVPELTPRASAEPSTATTTAPPRAPAAPAGKAGSKTAAGA